MARSLECVQPCRKAQQPQRPSRCSSSSRDSSVFSGPRGRPCMHMVHRRSANIIYIVISDFLKEGKLFLKRKRILLKKIKWKAVEVHEL